MRININHGLLTLGKVITALVEREKAAAKGRAPAGCTCRTASRSDAAAAGPLGGNTRTVMIACVSAAEIDTEATLSTCATPPPPGKSGTSRRRTSQ